jgi:hypothetical protein
MTFAGQAGFLFRIKRYQAHLPHESLDFLAVDGRYNLSIDQFIAHPSAPSERLCQMNFIDSLHISLRSS